MSYQDADDQFSQDYSVRLDPQQLAELVKAVIAAQQNRQGPALAQDATTDSAGYRAGSVFPPISPFDGLDLQGAETGLAGQAEMTKRVLDGPAGKAQAATELAARVAQAQAARPAQSATLGQDGERTPSLALNSSVPQTQSITPPWGRPIVDPQQKTALIREIEENRASQVRGFGAKTRSNPAAGQSGVNRPQIPLGGAPASPSVPADWLDTQKINTLTVKQVAGIILGENGSGRHYKVEPLRGRSTAEDLHKAKTAQALAVINGDLRLGKDRPKTHDWRTSEAQRKTPEYQQALEAARAAFQGHRLGDDLTGRRMHFNNRFEKDAGKNEEHLQDDRIVRDKNKRPVGRQKPFLTFGPFTVGGGKVWTLVYDDTRPVETARHASPERTLQPVPGRRPHRGK